MEHCADEQEGQHTSWIELGIWGHRGIMLCRMKRFQRICVYCGSRSGNRPAYTRAAVRLGTLLAEREIGLVYGGGSIGLMGKIADAVLANGGSVTGVIPQKLHELEVGHARLTEMIVVDSMHTRKRRMAELSDGFIAMPGGYGTLEELAEVTTWTQLNDHLKPVGLLNIEGYWDPLLAQIERMVQDNFVRPLHAGLISNANAPEALLTQMAEARIPLLEEWIGEARRQKGR